MTEPASFEFLSSQPNGVLGDVVESLWFARGTVPYRQEHIAPTGSVVAIFVFGDPIEQMPLAPRAAPVQSRTGLFVGPHDGPVINRPLGGTFAVGIVARPTGAERLFGVRPAAHRGMVSQLLDVWPIAESLRNGLLQLDGGSKKLNWLKQQLVAEIRPELHGESACRTAIAILESDPKTAISCVADRVNMSISSLVRTFTRLVGLTPRALSNILKMRRLLASLDVQGDVDWVGTAVDYGWYDQAHFVRAFKRHTAHTPTAYLASQRTHFDSKTLSQAAGFVPED